MYAGTARLLLVLLDGRQLRLLDCCAYADTSHAISENGCKWRYTENDGRSGQHGAEYYRFGCVFNLLVSHCVFSAGLFRCDQALAFAEACNMTFRGHALVWGKEGSLPDWLQPSHVSHCLTKQHA